MMTPRDRAEVQKQLRWMRAVSLLEGSTLVLLVLVAVPLKHLAGFPIATTLMGSIHGMAFLLYIWMLIQMVSGGGWSRSETTRMVVAAFIPFGAFVNERALARRQAALATPA
jgi:integral membrane protein